MPSRRDARANGWQRNRHYHRPIPPTESVAGFHRDCSQKSRSLCGRTRGEEVRSHLVEFDNDGRSLLYFVEGDRFLVAMEMKGDRG
jgi:hypothetical protein